MQVIIVTSIYHDRESYSTMEGVWDSNDAFKEGMRAKLADYAEEIYSLEDIAEYGYNSYKEYADAVLRNLIIDNEANDPLDGNKTWFLYDETVKSLDYEDKIRKFLLNNEDFFVYNEDFVFSDYKIRFFMPYADGSADYSLAETMWLAKVGDEENVLYLKDKDETRWRFSELPKHKQRELYDKMKNKIKYNFGQ